jgi:hypothetical protein
MTDGFMVLRPSVPVPTDAESDTSDQQVIETKSQSVRHATKEGSGSPSPRMMIFATVDVHSMEKTVVPPEAV